MSQGHFNRILELLGQGRPCVVATVVLSMGSAPRRIGARMIIERDGAITGTIGGGGLEKTVIADALRAQKRKKSELKTYSLQKKDGIQVCGGKVGIFFEVLEPARQLIICGAGHIGLALSYLGKLLGFEVVVLDNRKAFANIARFPHADRVLAARYEAGLKRLGGGSGTFIVIVTHGHAFDGVCLEAALKMPTDYVGMIGSRRKIKDVFAWVKKKGIRPAALKRVHTPVGLDIGAETPEEIAVAIMAEIVADYRL
jgi:xanthine dehydrogenase accessory factor